MRRHHIVLSILVLLATACSGRALGRATSTPVPPSPEPPTPVVAPSPTVAPPPTPAPTVPAPDWLIHSAGAFTVSLPATWQVVDVDVASLDDWYAALEQNSPEQARMIGSKEALAGAALWAFNADTSGEGFADNLNIRRSPLDGELPADLQTVVEGIIAQHKEAGLANVAGRAGLSIGGRPAGRITYTLDVNGDKGATTVSGYQFVVAGRADFWVLSYTVGSGRMLEEVVERSVESFRAK